MPESRSQSSQPGTDQRTIHSRLHRDKDIYTQFQGHCENRRATAPRGVADRCIPISASQGHQGPLGIPQQLAAAGTDREGGPRHKAAQEYDIGLKIPTASPREQPHALASVYRDHHNKTYSIHVCRFHSCLPFHRWAVLGAGSIGLLSLQHLTHIFLPVAQSRQSWIPA